MSLVYVSINNLHKMYSFNNKQQTKKRSLFSSMIVWMWKLRGVEVLLYESRVDRLFLLTHMSV